MKCITCGYEAPSYLVTPEKEAYCSETCMHVKYTESEIEWLFDKDLIEWKEREDEK